MDAKAFDLMPTNPLRPVDWRWLRAARLAAGQLPSRILDDTWTKAAGRFRQQQQSATAANLYTLTQRSRRDMFMATNLASQASLAYKHLRAELAARILAGESDRALAERFGLEPTTINLYEKLYFDIRSRLQNKSFVLHMVIGGELSRLAEGAYAQLWMLFGYYAGPAYLDTLITGLADREMLTGLSVNEGMDALISTKRRQKGLLAAMTTAVNPMTVQTLWDGWDKLKQLEQSASNAGIDRSSIINNLGAMISHLPPFTLGQPTAGKDNTTTQQRIATYEATCELRADELVLLGSGKPLPEGHAKALASIRYRGADE